MTEPEPKTHVIGSRVIKGGMVIYRVSAENQPSQIIMKATPKSSEKDQKDAPE